MIHVDRSAVVPPKVLEAIDELGHREREANEIAKAAGQKLRFDAYHDGAVKVALRQAFGSKCCFCECVFVGTQPGDAEHFRPKGWVVIHNHDRTKKQKKPGYYWLAARWSNLLCSCSDCNRPRTQYDEDGTTRVFGKQNFFPLEKEGLRAALPGGEVHEQPLLLDPCVDQPEDHIEFTDDGRVKPRLIAGVPSARGEATIYYCGLRRVDLLKARAVHARFVRSTIRNCLEKLDAKRELGQDFDDLLFFLLPSSAHVAYTRHLVRTLMRPYLAKLGLNL